MGSQDMSVSWRNILTGAASIMVLGASGAAAQTCCGHNPNHSVTVPGVNVGVPTVTVGSGGSGGSSGPGCCGHSGHDVRVPGVQIGTPSVYVGGSVLSVGVNTLIGGSISANASATNQVISSGGGYYAPSGVEPGLIEGLNVGGETETYMETVTEQVPVTEQVCIDRVRETMMSRAVQAVCIDDKGMPHPAAQVFPDQAIPAGYTGEVFRCVAGSSMQVTFGDMTGANASFAGGQTMVCNKGEALVAVPGQGLECRPQTASRDCNERSLLRRHGAGIKTITMRTSEAYCEPTTRTVMKTVTKQVERTREKASTGNFVMDGGVGQGIY